MNRERVKELLPIMQAYAEGKVIQSTSDRINWADVNNLIFNLPPDYYRIKQEPKIIYVNIHEGCMRAFYTANDAKGDDGDYCTLRFIEMDKEE